MKKKASIVIAILLLAVGFAAISTTLIIKGSTKVSENTDDFSVTFSAASLDGTDVYASVIDNTKKVITFETSELKTLNQTSVLNYEVTNNSANYDAEVTVNCKVKDGTTAKYTSITNELEGNATKVLAKNSVNGTLTVTLNKTATEEVREEYVCELTFNAVERDTLGSSGPTYYYAFGTPTTASATDYTTLGKKVFVRLGTDDSKALCINDNELFCIKPNDYDNSVLALKNHFGESSCNAEKYGFSCSSDAFYCYANSTGNSVNCNDIATTDRCIVGSEEYIVCD